MNKYLKIFMWAGCLNLCIIVLTFYAYNWDIGRSFLPLILFLFGQLQGYKIFEMVEK